MNIKYKLKLYYKSPAGIIEFTLRGNENDFPDKSIINFEEENQKLQK